MIGVSVSGYSKYIGQSKLNTDIQNAETVRAAVVNAQAESGVYEELLANGGKTVTVTIENTGIKISGADLPKFTAAIKSQLQMTGDSDTKLKTQYAEGIVTITATTPATGDGSATVKVAGNDKYPKDKSAGILQPAAGSDTP